MIEGMKREPAAEETACELCGGREARVLFERRGAGRDAAMYAPTTDAFADYGRVVRCTTCGLARTSPRPAGAALADFYRSASDPKYLEEERGRRATAHRYLAQLERRVQGGCLLDVGCGPGLFLTSASERWRKVGVELSGWAAGEARRRFGLDVREGSLMEAGLPDASVDAALLVDVVEHLPDPRAVLRELARVMRSAGALFILTPDIDAPVSRLMGRWWWGLRPAHIHYFSRRTLTALLEDCGFEVLTLGYWGRTFSLGYWISRMRGYAPRLVDAAGAAARWTGLGRLPVRINTYDSVGLVAIRKARPIEKRGKKVTAILPAYNAEHTLGRTVADMPPGLFDETILVDDASRDGTVELARRMGLKVFVHPRNRGYGGNQKTCYREALAAGADVVVMVHPDYQYDPRLATELVAPILEGNADCVLGSRMLKDEALKGKMPVWKYAGNKFLTAAENLGFGAKFSEYHTGYRAYSREVLSRLRLDLNNDGFVFDQQIIAQMLAAGIRVAEVPIPTRYFKEASSVNFATSVKYGLQTLGVILRYRLHRHGIRRFPQYGPASGGPGTS